jgi:DNA-binding MarR family transcriptional regulator
MSASQEHDGPTPGFLVWRLSMKIRASVDRALAPLGLTHAQYSLLSSLLDMQERGIQPSQRELADHTGLEPLYVSKLARTLETAGFITRDPDPHDSRAVRLTLSAAGLAVACQAITVVRQLMDQLLTPLGGIDGSRTQSLVRDLTALLDAPVSG